VGETPTGSGAPIGARIWAMVEGVPEILSPVAYGTMLGATAVLVTVGCIVARRWPGRVATRLAQGLAVVLLAKAALWVWTESVPGPWTPTTGLPLYLCDAAVFVAAAACWWRRPLLVEVTWFWALAGVIQAIATPDVADGFPHILYIQYMVGHLGVVAAAIYLVVGLRCVPRRGAVGRVLAITVLYTAAVGGVDAVTGANYMFLRHVPSTWSLLDVLGPWPWYTFSALGVAVVLLTLLDLPFWPARRQAARPSGRSESVLGAEARAGDLGRQPAPPLEEAAESRVR